MKIYLVGCLWGSDTFSRILIAEINFFLPGEHAVILNLWLGNGYTTLRMEEDNVDEYINLLQCLLL